jgi:tetratricopeptide (TPR) repeat protein
MRTRSKFALAAFMCFSLFAAETRWIKVKSANFDMYTTASERSARETLKYFEQVRSFFQQGMGSIPGKQLPVRIVAFNSKKEYEPYRLNNFATAFYHPTPTSDDIVLSETGYDVFPVAVHEYVHLVTKHMGMNLPPWLSEGMAELYSTLKPMGDKVLVGTLIAGRYQALLNEKWVPLKVIVNADHSSPYYNEKNQAGSLYNEGWALTHMLVLTNEYRPGFAKFLEMVNAGTPTEEALNKAYGKSIADVDKELQVYLHGTHFQGAFFALKLEKITDEITAEPAPEFDVKLVLADLLDRPGNESETRAAFEKLTVEDPKRPEPFAALGYLAWHARDNDGAMRNFGRAFELGGKEPQMLWDYGRMLRGRNPAEAIRVLSELVALQPGRNDVRLEVAANQLTAREPGAALDTLKPVKKVSAEEAPRLFAIMAHAQLDMQQWNDAKQSAERLQKVARTDDDKFQAERILKYLDARATGGAPVAMPSGEERPLLLHKEQPREQPRLAGEPVSEKKSIPGSFAFFDCSGKAPKIVLETAEGQKVFLVDDPKKVLGATMELTCGAQNKDRVRVDFIPAHQAGVDGLVRGIRVEP